MNRRILRRLFISQFFLALYRPAAGKKNRFQQKRLKNKQSFCPQAGLGRTDAIIRALTTETKNKKKRCVRVEVKNMPGQMNCAWHGVCAQSTG